jgi:hypothetical protein
MKVSFRDRPVHLGFWTNDESKAWTLLKYIHQVTVKMTFKEVYGVP